GLGDVDAAAGAAIGVDGCDRVAAGDPADADAVAVAVAPDAEAAAGAACATRGGPVVVAAVAAVAARAPSGDVVAGVAGIAGEGAGPAGVAGVTGDGLRVGIGRRRRAARVAGVGGTRLSGGGARVARLRQRRDGQADVAAGPAVGAHVGDGVAARDGTDVDVAR